MSRNPTLSYVLCSVPPLLNCNTKESMWDLLMKYLCPRDFRRGEMEETMKELARINEFDLTVNNKPRLRTSPVELSYGENYNYASLTRWLARWYKCYSYSPKSKPLKGKLK